MSDGRYDIDGNRLVDKDTKICIFLFTIPNYNSEIKWKQIIKKVTFHSKIEHCTESLDMVVVLDTTSIPLPPCGAPDNFSLIICTKIQNWAPFFPPVVKKSVKLRLILIEKFGDLFIF